jgi:hypothetical protein
MDLFERGLQVMVLRLQALDLQMSLSQLFL